jgi:bisphosphoglycerate-dependent phosphoglycerate mutase
MLEKFEDTKGVIRSRKLKERQYNGKKNKDKGRKKKRYTKHCIEN